MGAGYRGIRAWAPRVGVILAVACLLAATVGCSSSPSTPNASDRPALVVDRLVSSADGAVRLRADRLRLPVADPSTPGSGTATPRAGAVTVRIDAKHSFQAFQGVGAALTDSSAWLFSQLPPVQRRAALRALFDPKTGAGLSVVRLVIGSSDLSRSHYSYDDSPTPDPTLAHFSIDHDRAYVIPVIHEIQQINPGVVFLASPWSPPGWMKDSNSLTGGSLLPQYEPALAQYFVRYLQAYQDAGIPLGWVTVQNEPEFPAFTYPGMTMFPDQQARFIADQLQPALVAAHLPTRVLVYDHNWDDPAYPTTVLQHPGVAAGAAGVAFHCYQGDQAKAQDQLHDAFPHLAIWETECSGGAWQGPRATAFRDTATLVINGLQHWSGATLLWGLALDPTGGPHTGGCGTCRGVITIDNVRGTWQRNLASTSWRNWAAGRRRSRCASAPPSSTRLPSRQPRSVRRAGQSSRCWPTRGQRQR